MTDPASRALYEEAAKHGERLPQKLADGGRLMECLFTKTAESTATAEKHATKQVRGRVYAITRCTIQ